MALLLLSLLLVSTFLGTYQVTDFTLQNRCTETLWPNVLDTGGTTGPASLGFEGVEANSLGQKNQPLLSQLMSGDIKLNQGETVSITVTRSWMGQVSARTECSSNPAGRPYWDPLNCATGGGNCVGEECSRPYTTPSPTTLANFHLDGPNDADRYSISLLAGFNIPISIVPYGGSGECRPISCLMDLNLRCPRALQVRSNGRVVGCNSACLAFDQPEYCCTGAYENPDACKPSSYSQIFKGSCPAASTYPRDDPSSFVTCKGANYLISFC